MTPSEKEKVKNALCAVGGSIRIGLHMTADARGNLFKSFCDELQSLVADIQIKKEDQGGALPFLKVADNVRYQVIPADRELAPFLDFYSSADTHSESLKLPERSMMDQIQVPARLTVFISPQCPFCPQTVASVLLLAKHCKQIHVTVVDGELFPEAVKDAKIRSVPTVTLDNRFRWSGTIDLNEIVNIIISRDPARLGAESLQQMIEEGKAEELSAMMAERNNVFPAFLDLLTHPKWPVRLGAMVVFEYLNVKSHHLSIKVLNSLWDRFDSSADDIKGDILYLFGESGRSEIVERLKAVRNGSYPEAVCEAADEALGLLSEENA